MGDFTIRNHSTTMSYKPILTIVTLVFQSKVSNTWLMIAHGIDGFPTSQLINSSRKKGGIPAPLKKNSLGFIALMGAFARSHP